jgi:transcriptional regulator with XRE-family HTH domain
VNDPRRIEAALAHNLREWRGRRGWSQAELAARAGLSKGMLVQIEQSQTNPSIATLCKLANALGVALPRLVEVGDEPRIRRVARDDVAWLWQGRTATSGAGLIGGIEAPVPVELWDWRMGPSDAYDAVAHPAGTREILYALEGRVTVTVEGTEVTIAPGEGAVFQADCPHRYAAAGGRAARFMMVVIEPLSGPLPAPPDHSRKATIGSTRVARSAGRRLAPTPASSRTTSDKAKASGSKGPTP